MGENSTSEFGFWWTISYSTTSSGMIDFIFKERDTSG